MLKLVTKGCCTALEKICEFQRFHDCSQGCFNLAVACEVSDDIDAAFDWASKSYFKGRLHEVSKLYHHLEKRKKEKLKIEMQMKSPSDNTKGDSKN